MSSSTAQLFAQRLRSAMHDAGLPDKPSVLQAQFNAHFEGAPISRQTARNWLQGTFIPHPDKLQALADLLKINPELLLFDAPMPEGAEKSGQSLSVGELAMLKNYQSVDEATRLLTRQLIAKFAEVHKLNDIQDTRDMQQQARQLAQQLEQAVQAVHNAPQAEKLKASDTLLQPPLHEALDMCHDMNEQIRQAEAELRDAEARIKRQKAQLQKLLDATRDLEQATTAADALARQTEMTSMLLAQMQEQPEAFTGTTDALSSTRSTRRRI